MGKTKLSTRTIACAIVMFVSISAVRATTIRTVFTWSYNNKLLSLKYSFDQDAYSFYKHQEREYNDFTYYLNESSAYPVIENFANEFKRIAEQNDFSDWQTVECIISFIQTLKYKNDGTYEYPRFPIETLIDKGGDCEDTAILLEAILRQMGFDVVLVSPAKHMGVGIALKYAIDGAAFAHNDKYYYYIETTSAGWGIGDYPEHLSAAVAIYDPGIYGETILLSEYAYSFKNYNSKEAEELPIAKNIPEEKIDQPSEPTYQYNASSNADKPDNTFTINVDNCIIDGEKETMVTEKVSGENGEKIIATSK